MIITEQMKQYIALQRTGYGNADIARCYEKDIKKDYESIKNYLPETCEKILDIGCGLAGIDLFLSGHYQNQTELHLLDYNKIDKAIHYGYQKQGSIYNNLAVSAQFLKLNGVDKKKIKVHDAEQSFPCKKFDIIISLLSCGFHYPVEIYLNQIKKSKQGIVILDIRSDSGQIELLEKHFNSVEIIATYSKCERVLIK